MNLLLIAFVPVSGIVIMLVTAFLTAPPAVRPMLGARALTGFDLDA